MKKWKFILIITVLLVGRATPLFSQTKKEKELTKNADKLFEDQEYSKAEKIYSQLLSANVENSEFNYKYGACLLYTSTKKTDALKYLQFAVDKAPAITEAHFYLARAYHVSFQFDKAIALYKKFKGSLKPKELKNYQLDLNITECEKGKVLIKDFNQIKVIKAKKMKRPQFFRGYKLGRMGRKVLVKPAEFQTKEDALVTAQDPMLVVTGAEDDVLFFTAYKYGTEFGKLDKDIFMVEKMEDGSWGELKDLGPFINTDQDEGYPYLDPSGLVLYFSSKGHGGLGGYDLYKSQLDTVTGQWGKPINLGFAVNSPFDDLLYIVDEEGGAAFFASDRQNKQGEITVYKIIPPKKNDNFVLVKGEVRVEGAANNYTKIDIKSTLTGEFIARYKSNRKTGRFIFPLAELETYELEFTFADSLKQSVKVTLPAKNIKDMVYQKVVIQVPEDLSQPAQLVITEDEQYAPSEEDKLAAYDELASLDKNQIKDVKFAPNATKKRRPRRRPSPKMVVENQPAVQTPEELLSTAENDLVTVKEEKTAISRQVNAAYVMAEQKNAVIQNLQRELDQLLEISGPAPTEAQKEEIAAKQNELNEATNDAVSSLDYARNQESNYLIKQKEERIAASYVEALKLANSSGNSDAAIAKLEEHQQQMEVLQKELSSVNKEDNIDQLKKDVVEAKNDRNTIEQKLTKIKSDIDLMEEEKKLLENQIENTRKKSIKEELSLQVAELKTEKEKKESELITAEKQFKAVNNQLEGMAEQLALYDEIEQSATDPAIKIAEYEERNSIISAVKSSVDQKRLTEKKISDELGIIASQGSENTSSLLANNDSSNKNTSAQVRTDSDSGELGSNSFDNNSSISNNESQSGGVNSTETTNDEITDETAAGGNSVDEELISATNQNQETVEGTVNTADPNYSDQGNSDQRTTGQNDIDQNKIEVNAVNQDNTDVNASELASSANSTSAIEDQNKADTSTSSSDALSGSGSTEDNKIRNTAVEGNADTSDLYTDNIAGVENSAGNSSSESSDNSELNTNTADGNETNANSPNEYAENSTGNSTDDTLLNSSGNSNYNSTASSTTSSTNASTETSSITSTDTSIDESDAYNDNTADTTTEAAEDLITTDSPNEVANNSKDAVSSSLTNLSGNSSTAGNNEQANQSADENTYTTADNSVNSSATSSNSNQSSSNEEFVNSKVPAAYSYKLMATPLGDASEDELLDLAERVFMIPSPSNRNENQLELQNSILSIENNPKVEEFKKKSVEDLKQALAIQQIIEKKKQNYRTASNEEEKAALKEQISSYESQLLRLKDEAVDHQSKSNEVNYSQRKESIETTIFLDPSIENEEVKQLQDRIANQWKIVENKKNLKSIAVADQEKIELGREIIAAEYEALAMQENLVYKLDQASKSASSSNASAGSGETNGPNRSNQSLNVGETDNYTSSSSEVSLETTQVEATGNGSNWNENNSSAENAANTSTQGVALKIDNTGLDKALLVQNKTKASQLLAEAEQASDLKEQEQLYQEAALYEQAASSEKVAAVLEETKNEVQEVKEGANEIEAAKQQMNKNSYSFKALELEQKAYDLLIKTEQKIVRAEEETDPVERIKQLNEAKEFAAYAKLKQQEAQQEYTASSSQQSDPAYENKSFEIVTDSQVEESLSAARIAIQKRNESGIVVSDGIANDQSNTLISNTSNSTNLSVGNQAVNTIGVNSKTNTSVTESSSNEGLSAYERLIKEAEAIESNESTRSATIRQLKQSAAENRSKSEQLLGAIQKLADADEIQTKLDQANTFREQAESREVAAKNEMYFQENNLAEAKAKRKEAALIIGQNPSEEAIAANDLNLPEMSYDDEERGTQTNYTNTVKKGIRITPTSRYGSRTKIPIDVALPEGLIYKVQVGAFRNKINPKIFNGISPLTGERTNSGIIRYTAGLFNSFKAADMAKGRIRNLGYSDAFVVVFYNGARISMDEADKIRAEASSKEKAAYELKKVEEVEKLKKAGIREEEALATTSNRPNPVDQGNTNTTSNTRTSAPAPENSLNNLSGIYFTVQVGVYSTPKSSAALFNITPLNTYQNNNGTIRYSTGVYRNLSDAKTRKDQVRAIGISDAYVVAYKDGIRITVEEATAGN